MTKIDELMTLACKWAKAFAECNGAHCEKTHTNLMQAENVFTYALEAALKPGEPHHWIVPEFGFLFPTEDAARRYLENIGSSEKPTACYTVAPPAQTLDPLRTYVEQFAAKGGWTKDSGEGAFEFVQRISYAQGVEDGRNRSRQVPTEQEHIRDLLIQTAAMAIVLERKGQYQSATKVADAIMECEASALSLLEEVLCDPTGQCSIICSDGDKEIINTALDKLKGKSQ